MGEPLPGRGPWALITAITLSVAAFVIGIGVAAFVTRDRAPARALPVDEEPVAAEAPAQATISDAVVEEALTAVTPGVARCFADSRARDPAATDRAVLEVAILLEEPARLTAVRAKVAPSPFFRPCLQREATPWLAMGSAAGTREVTAVFEDGAVRYELEP